MFTYVLALGIARMTSLDMYYFWVPFYSYILYSLYDLHTEKLYLAWLKISGAFPFILIRCLEGSCSSADAAPWFHLKM
jgi:hypothetical protein